MTSHDLTFFPFVFSHHWVGLIARRPDRTSGSGPWHAYIINSINGCGTDSVAAAFKALLSHPAGTKYGLRPESGDRCVIHLAPTRQQGSENSSDCGVLMVHTMLDVMAHPENVGAPAAPTWPFHQLRRWLALLVGQPTTETKESC